MREIVCYPNPVLNKPCRPLTDEEIKSGMVEGESLNQIVEDMIAVMRENGNGAGLAAPQVGLPLRVFIAELPSQTPMPPLVFINPTLSEPNGEDISMAEGCLSFPGVKIKVKRTEGIKIKAKNLEGKEIEFDLHGILARVVQHETDHCWGRTILQKGNYRLYRSNIKVLEKLEKEYMNWGKRLNKKKG
jgi:peptide deformylase